MRIIDNLFVNPYKGAFSSLKIGKEEIYYSLNGKVSKVGKKQLLITKIESRPRMGFKGICAIGSGCIKLIPFLNALIYHLSQKKRETPNNPAQNTKADVSKVIDSKDKTNQASSASFPNKDQIVVTPQSPPTNKADAHQLLVKGGQLIGTDNVIAEKLMLQAVDAGSDAAFLLLGRFYLGEKNNSKAITLLEEPAKKGISGCRELFALALENDNRDLTEVLFWYKEAYKLDSSNAEIKANIERVESNIKVLSELKALNKKLLGTNKATQKSNGI